MDEYSKISAGIDNEVSKMNVCVRYIHHRDKWSSGMNDPQALVTTVTNPTSCSLIPLDIIDPK